MAKFKAEIEFSIDYDASIYDAETELKFCLEDFEPLVIKSIVKTSISQQEALKQIQKLLDRTAAYRNVTSEEIQSILNNVA